MLHKHLPIPPPGAQNILIDNPPSSLTQEDLDLLRKEHKIPEDIQMRLPQGEERADWMIPGCSTVYLHPFEYGFKLPVSGLLKSFCEFEMVNPSQLAPNTFRKIFGTEKLLKMYNLKWNPIDFFQFYWLRRLEKEPGRFLLVKHCESDELITNLPHTDMDWKEKYFFVSGNWISNASDRIPHFWNPEPLYVGKKQCYPRLQSGLHAEQILLISTKLRDWEELLILIHKEDGDKGKDKGKRYFGGLSTAKALQRIMAKANANTAKSNEQAKVVQTTKRSEPPPPEVEPRGQVINISLPSFSSLKNNPKPFLIETRKLLVPEDEKIMRAMKPKDLAEEGQELALKLFQHQVYKERESDKLRNSLSDSTKTIQELRSSHIMLNSRLEASKKVATVAKERIKKLETEVNRLKRKHQDLISQVDQQKLDFTNKDEQLQELHDDACLRVKGPLMRKYLRGKITEAYARKSVSDWETYLNFLGESIPNTDSESDEEV